MKVLLLDFSSALPMVVVKELLTVVELVQLSDLWWAMGLELA
jgi:hypothetical protein